MLCARFWVIPWRLKFSMPAFRNTLSVPYSFLPMKMKQTECYETLAYKFKRRGITQKKAYNIQNYEESLKSRM
jgi:hypothetical protein